MKCNHKLSPQYSRDELHRIIHYCENCDAKCFAFNKDNSPIWEDEKSQTYIPISLIKEVLREEEKVAYQDIINFLKNKGYKI